MAPPNRSRLRSPGKTSLQILTAAPTGKAVWKLALRLSHISSQRTAGQLLLRDGSRLDQERFPLAQLPGFLKGFSPYLCRCRTPNLEMRNGVSANSDCR